MDHGGEAARLTTVGSTDLGMASAVQGGEAHMTTGTFQGQLGAAAAGRVSFDGFEPSAAAYHNYAEFVRHVRAAFGDAVRVAVFHREPGPGVMYANTGASWQQPGPLDAVLVGPQLPDGVVPVHDNYGYSALQPRPDAERAVVLPAQLPGGVVYSGDYVLQPRPGAGHGEVLVDLLPGGAGHGEVFVGLLLGGIDAVYDSYGYYGLQPRPGARHGEALVDLLPNGARHGEVFVDLLPGGGVTVHDDYGYYPWQPRPGAGRGDVFIGPLPDGVSVVFDGLGSFAQQTLPGTRRADGMAGALRVPNLGAGYDGSVALADGLGAVYDDPGMSAAQLRRLLGFVGIGASSVAVNGLAAGPGSPAVAFNLFVLLLGSLFLVILHVLHV